MMSLLKGKTLKDEKLTSWPKQCQSFGPPALCLIVGSCGYVLTVSVNWMGVVERVVVKSFVVMGVTIDLSTTRYSNPKQKKLGLKP